MAKQPTQVPEDTPLVFDIELSDTTIGGMCKRRASEASAHWNKEYDLDKVREENKKIYTSDYIKKMLRDERYEVIFSDNKIFTAVRTILAFISGNITQPDIVPANDDSLSLQFAQDFNKILVEVLADEYGRDKVKLMLQDLLIGQRVGTGKWVYDPFKDKLCFEYCDPASIIIGKRSRLHEEPDFVRQKQKRTIGDLIRQFSEKKDDILRYCEIEKGVPSQLEKEVEITENWIFIEESDMPKLAVVFMLGEDLVLGKMSDPNWIEGKNRNVIGEHMMPFVFINFLNDGSGYIDNTSFIEQAQYNQKQYDMRGQTIAENAAYAGTGVPVFAKDAIKEETAAQLKFSPIQRVLLNSDDVGKAFTTWTGGSLPTYVFEDKQDMKESVLDIYGSNQIQTGAASDNKTLGQDVLLRNQAEGRQQELVDCVENGILRSYKIEAQMVYRYFDDVQYYNFIGDDGQFEHLAISQQRIAQNLGIKIKIKTGSGLPVDRSQRIAQALELAKMGKIGTLKLYKELGVEDPEDAYAEFLRETLLPFGELTDLDKDTFNREADEDLQLVIAGKEPKERDDITQEYLTHLQEYLLTQKYEHLPQAAQSNITQFVANIIAQAKRKTLKMQTQQPVLPDDNGQMPPIRPKISLSGKDLQPDVLAQLVQASGYKPSQLTPMEMAAGFATPPQERIDSPPLGQSQAAPPTPVQQ